MGLKQGYKQTDAGVIPEEWDVNQFSQLLEFRNGLNADRSAYGGGVPFINVLEIINKTHLRRSDIPGRVSVRKSVVDSFSVRRGDLVFNRSSETQEEVGFASVYLDDEPVVFGGFVIRGRPAGTPVDPVYSGYAFRARSIRSQIVARGQGAIRANIGQADLRQVVVPVPPHDEQIAIAQALSDFDALLWALESLIAKKRNIRQATMQQLLTGKQRLSGFHASWEAKRLGTLVTDGPTNGYSGRTSSDARGTPTLRLTATTSGYLILNEESIKRLVESIPSGSELFLRDGDLLIQRSNTADLVGTAAIFHGPPNTYVYPDLMMRLRFSEKATCEWIWRYANSNSGRRFFLGIAAGSTGSMPKIGGKLLRKMMVPFPPLAERVAILRILSDMDAEITALKARRDKTRALKQGMMQELLTGRTRLV